MTDSLQREHQLVSDVIASFQEIDVSERYGSLENQRLQHIAMRITYAISDAMDDIATAVRLGSPIEAMMYLRLRDMKLGNAIVFPMTEMKIESQYPIGPYTADFFVSMNGVNVVIECDGHGFHEKTREQAEHDKKRDRYMTANGYKVLRYSGSELYNGRLSLEYDLLKLFYVEKVGVAANGVD